MDQDHDHIPVRDVDTHSSTGNTHPEPGGADRELQDTHTRAKPDVPGTVQWGVLGELKALIAGQGEQR